MKLVEPTIMENPIGPLITQLGMGLSFNSQHLRTLQTNSVNHIQTRPIRFILLRTTEPHTLALPLVLKRC